MTSTARNRTRVILHVDLDAFYCQVEMKRVGIPPHVPCAVQQWEGLIAINYPARAAGITRHMRRAEAKAKCPELQCVHVETIGGEAGTGNDSAVTWEDRKTQKACLERYRVASAEIIAVFHEVAPEGIVEKASIDEAYIDVTSIVDAHLQGRSADTEGQGLSTPAKLPDMDSPDCGNHIIGGSLDFDSEFERRLAVGAQLACHLRAAVKEKLGIPTSAQILSHKLLLRRIKGELTPLQPTKRPWQSISRPVQHCSCCAGFTCSAGVACNKLLAKLASAMHKPSQQTVVPPRAVPDLMKDLPLKKIRNFGGKLGAELQALGCNTAGDVLALPPGKLQQNFGERASWILYTLQGNSDEQVQEKERPKSMLAAKSFEPTSELTDVERWVMILAEELADRMTADNKQFNRRPRSLHLQYRGGGGGFGSGDRSKSCPMPRFLKAGPTAPIIAEVVMKLFQKCGDAMPCTRLAVSASDFEDGPLTEGQGSITKFFGAGGVPAVPAMAAISSQAVRQPSRASQLADKPRSKHAAVALMFKGAKQGSALTASHPAAATGEAQTDSASCPHPLQEAHSSPIDVAERNKEALVNCGSNQVRGSDAAAQASYHEQQGKSDDSSRAAAIEHGTSNAEMASGSQESGRDSDAQEMPDTVLGEFNGVDIAEQRQILHDLWLQRNASLTKAAVKRPAIGGGKLASKRTKPSSVQKAKQSQLSGLLRRTDAS